MPPTLPPARLGPLVLVTLVCAGLGASPLHAGVTLLGKASIPGDAHDRSGLTGEAAPGIPSDRLGSFGSGIAWTGEGTRYIAVDDRGPLNGEAPWRPRFHTFDIRVDPASASPITVELTGTVLLSDQSGRPLNGAASALDAEHPADSARLDPDGVRISPRGTVWLSDEYGPWVDEYWRDGRRLRRLSTPDKFLSPHPSARAKLELPPACTSGRQPNRGLEGLAISPDGSTLWAIMQSPLIQDGALNDAGERTGVNIRIIELHPGGGATRELLYPLESAKNGVNEMLAVRGGPEPELLVLERDGKAGASTKSRALYRVSLAGATDISAIASLPAAGAPEDVHPVKKSKFLDFLDPRFALAGASMPEKIEGLAFGPDLPDGRRLLIVTTDNDLKADEPSQFWAFAIDAADLPGFEPQRFDEPVRPQPVHTNTQR